MSIMDTQPKLKIVTSELSDPPYPKTTTANGFGFDIDVNRMLESDSWVIADAEVRPWLLLSWVVSWAQRPCGSLPGDDRVLVARLGCSLKFFQVHRDIIMRGWEMHSDGRLYHPVVTEKVLEMLDKRDKWKSRQDKARKKNQELNENVTGDSSVTHDGVTPVSRLSSSSSSSSSKVLTEPSKALANKIPLDWQPNDASVRWLAEHGITDAASQARLVSEFRTYWVQVGSKKSNWDLAFIRNPAVKSGIRLILREREKAPMQSSSSMFRGGV